MKKTILLLLILTLNTQFIHAQEPTKKQTFDFIIELFSGFNGFTSNGGPARDVRNCSISDYNYEQLEVTLKFKDKNERLGEYRQTYNITLNLKDLSWVIGVQGEFRYLDLGFKKSSISIKIYSEAIGHRSYENKKARLYFSDKKTVTRLEKACNHLIKLNGGIVNKSLFD